MKRLINQFGMAATWAAKYIGIAALLGVVASGCYALWVGYQWQPGTVAAIVAMLAYGGFCLGIGRGEDAPTYGPVEGIQIVLFELGGVLIATAGIVYDTRTTFNRSCSARMEQRVLIPNVEEGGE